MPARSKISTIIPIIRNLNQAVINIDISELARRRDNSIRAFFLVNNPKNHYGFILNSYYVFRGNNCSGFDYTRGQAYAGIRTTPKSLSVLRTSPF